MILYLREDLLKSEGAKAGSDKPADVHSSKGEQRGGQYVARAQVGYDHDGSPKYRYFKTEEEYETYLKGKGRSEGAKKLEDKVKKEHKESTEKQKHGNKHQPASRGHALLSTEKSLANPVRLFVRT